MGYKKFFEKNYINISRWAALIILAVCFFIGVSYYNFYIHEEDFIKWGSPDATANYIFTKLYAQTGEMEIFEKYNLYAQDVIHPRSIRSDYGEMKPVSFLGIILIYGKIASILGYKVIPYLTPFFASITIIFFYLLIKNIFGKNTALISAFLLASFPPYIYYSARSMFHNVLFVSFLIIGLYFAVIMVKNRKGTRRYLPLLFASVGGFLIGLSIITRPSELLWLGPVLFLAWIFNIKKVGFSKLILFCAFLGIALVPMISWNQILYSSLISGGYPEMNTAILNISKASTDLVKTTAAGKFIYTKELLGKIKENIFHFGFNSKQSLKMLYYYYFEMFTALFFLSVLGFLLFLQKMYKRKKKYFVYILCLLILSCILIFYYGSWEFYDNPDKTKHTIGNSYTRYWLPIYLGFMPFASYFIIKFTRALFPKRKRQKEEKEVGDNVFYKLGKSKFSAVLTKKYFGLPSRKLMIFVSRVLIVALIFISSILFTLYGSEEGLIYSAVKQRDTKLEWESVLNNTESNSVIITQYHDKLFFPDRKVIVGLFNDDNMNQIYADLARYIPVYYYNFTFPEKDFNYLNNSKLKKVNLNIETVKEINQSFTLYKLKKIKVNEK